MVASLLQSRWFKWLLILPETQTQPTDIVKRPSVTSGTKIPQLYSTLFFARNMSRFSYYFRYTADSSYYYFSIIDSLCQANFILICSKFDQKMHFIGPSFQTVCPILGKLSWTLVRHFLQLEQIKTLLVFFMFLKMLCSYL